MNTQDKFRELTYQAIRNLKKRCSTEEGKREEGAELARICFNVITRTERIHKSQARTLVRLAVKRYCTTPVL